MTQLQAARSGVVTEAMEIVAADEGVGRETVRAAVASGEAVIPRNVHHTNAHPVGVGRMFTTKINANLGRSVTHSGKGDELEKLKIALDCKADFVMDLSVGSDDLRAIRQGMLDRSDRPLGTVPVYETISRFAGDIPRMDPASLLDVIRAQAEQGVDFMTLHAGLLLRHIPIAMKRIMGIVSRGGAIMAEWMMENKSENPLYTHWDEVMDILIEHDVTVSLGDGLRPGCLADASDDAQFGELDVLGELVDRCRARGVQVMVEGPGHVPFNQIRMNMERQQKVCKKAPFYVLGPVTTDIAPSYDHIASSIGAAAAATYGASLLCSVTPAEHLGLPDGEEVRQGCVAYKIAAHTGDIARGLRGARDRDDAMARARAEFDWDRQFSLCLDPERAKTRWSRTRAFTDETHGDDHCSMCGRQFCAVRTSRRIRKLAERMKGEMKHDPLVLCLTNSVAANFTANCLLAIGAKPAMVEDPSEAEELAAVADALLVNLGTVTERQAEAMRRAIKVANEKGVPWVLDPVGVQHLTYRRNLAQELIGLKPSLIRGNRAEIDSLGPTGIVTLATGPIDAIEQSNNRTISISGGVPMLQAVTATGCAQGGICAAFLGRGQSPQDAAVSASKLMKRAGEVAWERAKTPGSFQVALVDALWELSHD